MVDWAPNNRAALAQKLVALNVGSLDDEHQTENVNGVLRSLIKGLQNDDTVTHLFRRLLLHASCTTTYLLPLLLHEASKPQTHHLILSLLENLSIPEENLCPAQSLRARLTGETNVQLSLGLRNLKEELSQPTAMQALLAPLHNILAHLNQGLNEADLACVSATLSLVRNLLHVPASADAADLARYKNLLWVLFAARLGTALNQIMQSESLLAALGVSVVELLAQVYKMYAGSQLHQTLQHWLHPLYCDSSEEEDESNTSPAESNFADARHMDLDSRGITESSCSPDSDPALERPESAPPEIGPFRLLTPPAVVPRAPKRQVEPNESTSSDEGRNVRPCGGDRSVPSAAALCSSPPRSSATGWTAGFQLCEVAAPLHKVRHKPTKACHHHKQHRAGKQKHQQVHLHSQLHHHQPTLLLAGPLADPGRQEPCLRLQRHARARAHRILSLVSRDPSQLDLDTVMVDFTVQFLMGGYANLVQALMRSLDKEADKSHLFWAIVYFMKPCTELRINVEATISVLLSADLLLLLSYEAVRLLGAAARQLSDLSYTFYMQRQLHMLVNALRGILSGMEALKTHASEEQISRVVRIQQQVGGLRQFRQLLPLLICQCGVDAASLPYLRDLVLTNHLLISTQELANPQFPVAAHVALFAEPSILLRYTTLLKFYATNAPVLNDALFTVLHHVVGDVGRMQLLFQPALLKIFSEILASDLPLPQDWLDLIEYTIQQFIHRQDSNSIRATLQTAVTEHTLQLGAPREGVGAALCQSLSRLVSPCSGRLDALVAACSQAQRETGLPVRAGWVLDRLRELDLLQPAHYDELRQRLVQGEAELQSEARTERGRQSPALSISCVDIDACRRPLNHPSVPFLIGCVRRDLGAECLLWLQSELLEVCLVRGVLWPASAGARPRAPPPPLPALRPPPEPVPLYCQLYDEPTPLVPTAEPHLRALQSALFLRLLATLGLELPSKECVFATVPLSLPVAHIFAAAQKMAPLDKARLKFDPAQLPPEAPPAAADVQMKPADEAATLLSCSEEMALPPPPPPPLPVAPIRTANWLAMVSRQQTSAAAAAARRQAVHRGSSSQASSDDVSMSDDPYRPASTTCSSSSTEYRPPSSY